MPTSDWTPAVADVGNLLRARTKDRNSREVGTFNADTRPTDAQVTGLIDQAVSDLEAVVGANVPESAWGMAGRVAAIGAAMLVELSYFPEQVGTGRSPYDALKAMYDDRTKRLVAAVEAAGGTTTGEGGTALLGPAYSFPMTGDPFILGRRTPW